MLPKHQLRHFLDVVEADDLCINEQTRKELVKQSLKLATHESCSDKHVFRCKENVKTLLILSFFVGM